MANEVVTWVNNKICVYRHAPPISCTVRADDKSAGILLGPASCAVMFRTPVWIMVVFVIATLNPGASSIAVNLENVARGRNLSKVNADTIIYDKLNLNDGDDNTIGHVYFDRRVSFFIDLAKTHTIERISIKLTNSAYQEVESIYATLSFSDFHSLPTLKHTFLRNKCKKPVKEEKNDMYIFDLYRCCGKCCKWKFIAKGRFVILTIEKKFSSQNSFGIHDIDVRGQHITDDRNLALYRPVLEEHNVSCHHREYIANDAWTDDLFVKISRPPFRWRVDFGNPYFLGVVLVAYKGDWGDSKLVLISEDGDYLTDRRCPSARSELKIVNKICCNVSYLPIKTRWLEVRGTYSLPRMVELFAFSRSAKLFENCPLATEPPPTSPPTPTTAPLQTFMRTFRKLANATKEPRSNMSKDVAAEYQVQPSHAAFIRHLEAFYLFCTGLMSWLVLR